MAKVIIECNSKDLCKVLGNLSLALPVVQITLDVNNTKENFEYICGEKEVLNWKFWSEDYKESSKEDDPLAPNLGKVEEKGETEYWKIKTPTDFEETVEAIRMVKKNYPAVRVKSNTWDFLFDQAKLSIRKNATSITLGKLTTDVYYKEVEKGGDIDGVIGRIIYILSQNPTSTDQDIINELYGC